MNFDRTTTNPESYDPDGQVVRSTQTTVNQTDDSGDTSERSAGLGLDQPAERPGHGGGAEQRQQDLQKSAHNEETVNYEISKTVKNQVSDQGEVETPVGRGAGRRHQHGRCPTAPRKTYAPRSPDDLKQLTALVRSAVGYDEKRGDSVEVVNMHPSPPAPTNCRAAAASGILMLGFEKGRSPLSRGRDRWCSAWSTSWQPCCWFVKPMLTRFLEGSTAAAGKPGCWRISACRRKPALAGRGRSAAGAARAASRQRHGPAPSAARMAR